MIDILFSISHSLLCLSGQPYFLHNLFTGISKSPKSYRDGQGIEILQKIPKKFSGEKKKKKTP